MYDLLTAQEIRKMIRVSCEKNVSLEAIHHTAQKIGYSIRRIGGKKGYHKSVYTALQRHWSELMAYDTEKALKKSQKPLKTPTTNDYYTYNGESDRAEYDWELDESIFSKAVRDAVNLLLREDKRVLQTNIFGGIDDLTDKCRKEHKKKIQAKKRKEKNKEKKEQEEIIKKRKEYDSDSRRMVGGGLFGNEK